MVTGIGTVYPCQQNISVLKNGGYPLAYYCPRNSDVRCVITTHCSVIRYRIALVSLAVMTIVLESCLAPKTLRHPYIRNKELSSTVLSLNEEYTTTKC